MVEFTAWENLFFPLRALSAWEEPWKPERKKTRKPGDPEPGESTEEAECLEEDLKETGKGTCHAV